MQTNFLNVYCNYVTKPGRTFSFAVDFACVHGSTTRFLLLFLVLAALVKILDHHADEHVQHEERHQQEERYEVKQTPLVVIPLRLRISTHARVNSASYPQGIFVKSYKCS